MPQGINEQIGTVAAIEPKLHLREVGGKMFGANLVPRSDDAALQKRECGFDGVGGNASAVFVAGIFLGIVVDGFVLVFTYSGFISGQFVGDDYVHIGADVFLNVLRQGSLAGIFGMKEANIAAALPDTDNDFFVGSRFAATGMALFSADVGFIHFNRAVQHGPICFFHGCSDAVTEIPCSLVRAFVQSPDRALELVGAYAFLGFAEQQCCEEPLLQGEMGIIKNRASRDRELIVAALAIEKLLLGFQFGGPHLTAWALRAVWPTQPDKNLAAFFVGVEQGYNVN